MWRRPGGLCVAFLLCLACAAPPPPPPLATVRNLARPSGLKVVLIGIDGATFSVLRPLVAEGRAPTLGRLMAEGAHGILRSEKPILSPAIWTTIATGRSRRDHGIRTFVRGRSLVNMVTRNWSLVRSTDRRVSALWNWAGLFDRTVGFQGWWATWPAERVNGWMVSDHLPRSAWVEWTNAPRGVAVAFPEGLERELGSLIVDPADPPMDEIAELVEMTPPELDEFKRATRPVFAHSLSVFKFAYCSQRSYEEVALHMLERGQPDLMGIFLIANDPVSHTFWHYYEPDAFEGVDREKARRLGPLVPHMYEHNDRYVARLLERLDPQSVVIVVSDHGFEASGKTPHKPSWLKRRFFPFMEGSDAEVAVGQSGRHHPDGVFLARGPAVRPGATLAASIYDVAPTILALLGLPVPEDLDGRVLTEILEPDFLAAHPIVTVPSYEPYCSRAGRVADVDEQQIMEGLRALGYVE